MQKLAGGLWVTSRIHLRQPEGDPTPADDEVVLCGARRPGGAGRLLYLYPLAQLCVGSLEAHAAGRGFTEHSPSGEAQPGADSTSS